MILLSYIYIERVNYVDYHFKHSIVKREEFPVAVHNTKQFSTSSSEQKERPKACYVVLARNSELEDWIFSMRQLEARFNNRHNYPYVFLNDEEFSTEFKDRVRNLTDAKVEFGLIPPEHWGYPDYVDPRKAAQNRIDSADMIYGSSESYRHMCR
jgi:alpha 1,2-mannosyltransferase